jgi:hypothetical protein
MVDLTTAISECDAAVASILEKALAGGEVDVQG